LEDWALIRRLAAEGVPKAQIARRLGIARGTVISAVKSDAPPMYVRKPSETSFTVFEPRVRELLKQTPDMPATVLAERVGWTGSIRWFRDNVNRLRPEHRPVGPADRLVWEPGDAAQCDLWFPPRKIPLEDGTSKLLPVLVLAPAHSRFTLGRMVDQVVLSSVPDALVGEPDDQTSVNLVVNGSVVRTMTGQNSEQLSWQTWDVKDLAGQTARLVVVDNNTGSWGHILADQVTVSDRPAA